MTQLDKHIYKDALIVTKDRHVAGKHNEATNQ